MEQVKDAALTLLFAGALAFLGIVTRNLPAIMRALDAWIKLQITNHQQERVYAAISTAAGRIETKIDQGEMTVADVKEDNPKLNQILRESLVPVQESASAQGATIASLAPVVVGKVRTAPEPPQKP